MFKNKIIFTLFSAILATMSAVSQATIISTDDLGVQAYTIAWANCPSYCSGDHEGNTQYGTDTVTSTQNTYGNALAIANLSGSDFLPDLKVYSEIGSNQKATSVARALQGYNYTGDVATSFTLDLNLHGFVSDDATLLASVAIIKGSEVNFGWHIPTAYSEEIDQSQQGGTAGLQIESQSGDEKKEENKSGSITFDLDVGESFFILTQIAAVSEGGVADGLNTLTMNFEDSTGLQAVLGGTSSVEVPEPSTLMLFLASIALFFRRKLT